MLSQGAVVVPHLMLSFESIKKGSKDEITFKMMDTDTGQVVEMSAEVQKVNEKKRQPTWAETTAAEQDQRYQGRR